jgi:superfamily II DNA or RNA helicase
MRELRFALGYMPHRLWGHILLAQFLEKAPGKDFYTPREYIQNDQSTSAFQRLTPMQREVVRLLDKYSDRNLHRVFSRNKTVKEFQDRVDETTIRDHIRPYIEKYIYKALEIARDNRILLFTKDKGNRNIFPEDFLNIEKKPAEPLFSFDYTDRLSYALCLMHGESRLMIRNGSVEIVSNEPATFIVGNKLYFISEIDGKKLKPFLDKDQVVIPGEIEKKYFTSFVRTTLRDYSTKVSGFRVNEVRPVKKAELILETGLDNRPAWILSLHYNKQKIHRDNRISRFVNYTGEGTTHKFERFSRDEQWERRIINTLNESGLRSRDDKLFYLNEKFSKENVNSTYSAINFINETGGFLRNAGISLQHRFEKDYYLERIALDLESREMEDWFDVRAVVIFGAQKVPFLKLRNHILQGIREYELPDGKIAVLPEEWFVRYRAMFEFGKIKEDGILIHKQHFSVMDSSVLAFHPETQKRLESLNEAGSIPLLDVPHDLNARLRNYQVEGYTWLWFLKQNGFGGCLADDMGLGKTLQAIALLVRSIETQELQISDSNQKEAGKQLSIFSPEGNKPTSLVVVPASLLHNWISECARFAPGLRIYSYAGIQRNRDLTNLRTYDVIVSTYHTVRQDIDKLAGFRFHYVILDESQMIKNPSSRLYQSVADLQSDHRIVLTGTPIENSLTDLWSQINFVNPGLLGTLSFFKRSFVYPIEKKKDVQTEEKLKGLINPFILRRTKREVARELPPVLEQIRLCSMTEAQRRIYEEEKSLARNSILENLEEVGLERSSIFVLQALTRLRQLANHPAMLEEFGGIDSGKFTEVCRDVENIVAEGHKVLLFSSFVRLLDLFKPQLWESGVRFAYLTGSQNQTKRKEAIHLFQKHQDVPVFLISLKAGGTGLNLTAADYVFILDPWWNPAVELQALNRAHRIGQIKNVFVYRFISGNTIEEKIRHLQVRKRDLAESFVTSNNPLRGLTAKEILEFFE